MSNGTLPSAPNPPQPLTLLQKLVAAKEVWHLNKFDMQAWLTQRAVKKQQDGTLGQPDNSEDIPMPQGISVGDTYNYQQSPAAPSKGIGTLGTVALTAAAILGTGGIGAGIGVLTNLLTKPAAPAVAPQPQTPPQNFTDTSTDFGLAK